MCLLDIVDIGIAAICRARQTRNSACIAVAINYDSAVARAVGIFVAGLLSTTRKWLNVFAIAASEANFDGNAVSKV